MVPCSSKQLVFNFNASTTLCCNIFQSFLEYPRDVTKHSRNRIFGVGIIFVLFMLNIFSWLYAENSSEKRPCILKTKWLNATQEHKYKIKVL